MLHKFLFGLYVAISLAFYLNICMAFYDYSYNGYYADKIINWMWLILSLIMIVRFWKKKIARFFLLSVIIIVLLSILPMAVPFFEILNHFTVEGGAQRFKLDDNYRLERTRPYGLSEESICIYQRIGVLERIICRMPDVDLLEDALNNDASRFRIMDKSPQIQDARLIAIDKEGISIQYTIIGKEKTVFYKLNYLGRQ